MRWLLPVGLMAWLSTPFCSAGPADDAIVAMMRLSQDPNYSWVATVSDDARTYDIFGRTTRGGFTRVTMPVINAVRRKLGRSVTDTKIDLIFRGNVDCVIETDGGWEKPAELPPRPWEPAPAPPSQTTGSISIVGLPRAHVQSATIHLPSVGNRKTESPGAYSNLQLAVSHPHEELGVIVASHERLKVEGDIVSGALTELGAQLLLVRDGQEALTPLTAAGTFKLWLRDGIVAKYQVTLQGTLSVPVQSGHRRIEVHQVTETVVKDIGTTFFDVPAEAQAKLQ